MEDQDKNLGRNIRKDEDENEDVEGHSHYGSPAKGAPAKGLTEDGDDVEAHVHLNAPKINAPKIN